MKVGTTKTVQIIFLSNHRLHPKTGVNIMYTHLVIKIGTGRCCCSRIIENNIVNGNDATNKWFRIKERRIFNAEKFYTIHDAFTLNWMVKYIPNIQILGWLIYSSCSTILFFDFSLNGLKGQKFGGFVRFMLFLYT